MFAVARDPLEYAIVGLSVVLVVTVLGITRARVARHRHRDTTPPWVVDIHVERRDTHESQSTDDESI